MNLSKTKEPEKSLQYKLAQYPRIPSLLAGCGVLWTSACSTFSAWPTAKQSTVSRHRQCVPVPKSLSLRSASFSYSPFVYFPLFTGPLSGPLRDMFPTRFNINFPIYGPSIPWSVISPATTFLRFNTADQIANGCVN